MYKTLVYTLFTTTL